MKFYAQLNENNICTGISQLSGEVVQESLIEIPSFNSEYMWKKYENGEWSIEAFEPKSSAPIDEFERLKQQLEITNQAIAEITMMITPSE